MKRFLLLPLAWIITILPGFSQSNLNDLNVIFKHNFEDNTLGDYQFDEWNQDWLNPPWVNRQETLDIVQNSSDDANPTKTLLTYFPANSLGPEEGGTNWWTNLSTKYDEIYVSYDVMFMPGFEFQKGGKLPSVKGGSVEVIGDFLKPDGYDGFAGGIMFKVDRPSFYIYYPDANLDEYGATFEWGKHYTNTEFSPSQIQFEYTSGPVYFVPGEWHNLTYRMVLNTIKTSGGGNYDGILEGYFDGKLVTQISHVLFRHTADLGIDCLRMVTFFGGAADDWRNPIEEWLKIDNVLLYTYKDNINVPRGNTLSATDRTINYWRNFSLPNSTVPNAPVSLNASNQTTTSIRLNWEDKSNIEHGFKLYRASVAGGTFVEIATIPTNITNYTDKSLSQNTTYYYKVLAYNELGNSNATPELAASTLNDNIPAAPSGLSATLNSDTLVFLAWTDNSSIETGFEIERSGPNNMNTKTTFAVNSNITSYLDEVLQVNSTYSYRIRALNNDGYSPYSNTIQAVTPGIVPPSAPSLLKSTEFTHKTITISWSDNSNNEKGFLITRSIGIEPENTTTIQVNANDTLFTDNNLVSNTTYIYTIKAVNDAGNSPASNKDVATTLSVAETKRVKDGLIAYYNFGYDPDYIVRDLSGYGEPLNLRILKPNAVQWNAYNRLDLLSGTLLVSTLPATKIVSEITRTGEITVECWIRPMESDASANARIVSLAKNDEEIGFLVDQTYTQNQNEKALNYSIRMQTESTNEAGYPALSPADAISYLNMQHIAYVRDKEGNELIYVDGKKAADGFRPSSFSTWSDSYYLRLGNEIDMEHPWRGTFYSMAIYNKALSITEVSRNFSVGPCDSIRNKGKDFMINVYPNPVADIASVEVVPVDLQDYLPETSIRVLDTYGKVYYQKTIFDPNNQFYTPIDFSRYPSGIYFLQVISGSQHKSAKIIVR